MISLVAEENHRDIFNPTELLHLQTQKLSHMAEKMCNTINQNIEPYAGKLVNNYFKQFGTLLTPATNKNDLSQILIIQDNAYE